MENNKSIEVKNLTKKFGDFTSVNDISFDVYKGEIFGFLGANGAGKSTTIKMLCGILEPTSGDALVSGFSIDKEPDDVKKNIGYMSQKFSLYGDLTIDENLNFFGGIYGLQGEALEKRKAWALKISGLEDRENTLTSNLSVGFKQRLALGAAVMHEPKIVFLDEPTGGVDPISRRKFWDLIHEISEKGTTVFVTTHYLDEAEFCNRIILINAGKLIAAGSPAELKEEYIDSTVLEIDCPDSFKVIEKLAKEDYTQSVSAFGNSIHLILKKKYTKGDKELEALKDVIADTAGGRDNVRIDVIIPSLEDVFLNLLEKRE
ncbi:MAG TPA: ABC transporter ATP-binding protein [Ignavibacteria bacterium]|nr:ABC transporter ATP-binding protein [Ignavibacteria bacterium]HRA98927.1 ABC transporter ATP-binding protein [Ignavibacteria bacterium]